MIEYIKIILVMAAIGVVSAIIGYVIHDTEIGKKWKSGVGLIFVISVNVFIVLLFSAFLSLIIFFMVEIFHKTKGKEIFFIILIIVSILIAPIFFNENFDVMYSGWKNVTKSKFDE